VNSDRLLKLQAVAIMVVPLVVLVGILWFSGKIVDKVAYNCDLAEISPDIPIKVKEQCRQLRSKQ
jgi:hypothetical protein